MIEPRADRPHAITLGADKGYDAFGWVKTVAGQEKTKYRGRERVG